MFDNFVDKVIECKQCPRLTKYIEHVRRTKVKRFIGEDYWAKPLPGFGDPNAALLIIGLAPAAHGGNRTGRIFTGDSSGDWLAKALYETGFANQQISISKNDGYELRNTYITAIVKCAPPKNIPTSLEIMNCSQHLRTEIKLLGNRIKVIITLGKIAFDGYCKISGLKGLSFGHNLVYPIKEDKKLICSYHPSKRNTNTGTLTWDMWINVFRYAQLLLKL
ncbi:MAG: uracil-DNA glycosylase [Candidatus Nitrosocosmicus sp.]|uniref:uracil-DNA glycosylase n=1 Tax=Candidatus Nitrosocosmicus sp. FF01 TaxID=3397670 RepID=UPI002A6CFF55|nr:uracil-DNA glycosylase [Candidatus Nitrosocosmicus sp.]